MTRIRSVLAGASKIRNFLGRNVKRWAVAVAGRWEWQSPPWIRWTRTHSVRAWRTATATRARAAELAVAVLVIAGATTWWLTRPTPHYVTYSVTPPGLTEYNEHGISSIKPLTVVFSESVAPLEQIQKPVTRGITMSPAMPGVWSWTSDKLLQFTPKEDWPVDGDFSLQFGKRDLLTAGVVLESYRFSVRSHPFSVAISESQFYQDPRDPALKKLVATVKFTHPVDTEQLESRVSLAVAKDAEYLGLTPDSRHFTVAYDKFKLAAYIHSAALAMPRDDTPMTLKIDRGVRAARGGNGTSTPLESVVTIPGRTSLRFFGARMTIVDNARYEPEQILLLTSSSPVVERAFGNAVSVRVLPVRSPRQVPEDKRPYRWTDESEIGQEILAKSDPLTVNYVPSDEGGNTLHGFKFLAPVGRYLHVTVKDGIQGTGGYISGKPYVATVRVERYKRALTFLGTGSLLPLTGDRRVGFLARDIEKVDVEVARVLPNQLQHLAPQMWDFSRPALYDDLENKLVERFTTTFDYSKKQPGKPTYDSIDLGQYLDGTTHGRRGLFMLHLRSRGMLRRISDDPEEEEEIVDGGEIADTRLILVTDLGFIVKEAKDGSRDVFAQSIRTGLPVEGARIDLLGSNGLTVLSATTDVTGRARLPKPSPTEAIREKAPLLVLAQKSEDMSFMPLRSNGRELNLSRFDIGGVESATSPQQLSSYLFSDRGIYRPGETTYLGVITRTADWKASLAGLPLMLDITDPRGLVVSHDELKLSAASFDEIAYTSATTSPTGTYQAVAYLVRSNRRRETLGSTSFKVQEFEPDRLKVRLDLGDTASVGWLKSDEVRPVVNAVHLFGEPASGRRVEGDMTLTPVLPRFARYADYRFQMGETLPEPYQERLAAATTDASGNAQLNLDLKRFVGRAYRLNVLARAYEAEAGRNVSVQNSAIVSDAPYLVGVKPDGDLTFVRRTSARQARWLAVTQKLESVAADNLTLDWVQRKFVSVLTQQNNGTYKYVSQLRETVRESRSVKIAVGGSLFPLPTSEPGDYVLILRDAAGAELNKLSYTVAGQANLTRSLERNAELQVQLDKPAYGGGDTIEVSIRAPYVGAGLITIERERVFHYQWFKTTTTSSVQRVTLPQEFEGNGYVSVQFLRDPSSDELFMSPMSYGVAAFAPDLTGRHQAVTLETPPLIKPGAALVMNVKPAEPSRVAVLAVDEGILQVARYKNPDPLGFFFQKRMLEVDTRQILDLILPDFQRFVALAAPGGDADGSGFARQLNPFSRKRKAPVAFWSGVLEVGREGRGVRYTVPDYFNGRLRIVAIAVSPQRMGISEAGVEVKGDFILTPNVPAAAAPGDEFLVSVGVFNNTTGGSGPIRVEVKPSSGLSIVGTGSADLQIPDKREGVGEFRVRANAVLGSAGLTFVASRGTAQSQNEESVSVRPPVAYRTQLTLGRVDGASAAAPLTRDLYPERRTVEAAISAVPLVWGRGLTAYLDSYEYSCTEQLASKGVAGLILTARPEFGAVRSRDAQPLEAAFAMLRSRQNDQGGFGLWSSSPATAEFPTVYAAHVLVEARDKGHRIPDEVLASVNRWLTQFAGTPASSLADGRLRAYAVYILVRQGIKPDAAISNVEQELTRRYAQTWPTDLAAAYLASTYRLMQRTNDADRIIRLVPWSTARRDAPEDTYYDAVVHDAQLMYLLARHFPTRLGQAPSAPLETISRAISGNQVTSLSAAYTLLALDAYAQATASNVKLGITEINKEGAGRTLTLPDGSMPKVSIPTSTARLQFSKDGPVPAYYVINESGFERNPPSAKLNEGIEVVHEFLDVSGRPVTRATVGQDLLVRVRVRAINRDRVFQVAVVDLLPGGIEPVTESQPPADTSAAGVDPALLRRRAAVATLPVGVAERSDWIPTHVDVREDRVVMYGDVTKDAATFTYRARATNAGTFQAPPAFAEGMYNRTVTGLSLAGKLEIVKP